MSFKSTDKSLSIHCHRSNDLVLLEVCGGAQTSIAFDKNDFLFFLACIDYVISNRASITDLKKSIKSSVFFYFDVDIPNDITPNLGMPSKDDLDKCLIIFYMYTKIENNNHSDLNCCFSLSFSDALLLRQKLLADLVQCEMNKLNNKILEIRNKMDY